MGFKHHYAEIKEVDDGKEELQPTIVSVTTPWWKILISNFLAFSFGAGLMLLMAQSYATGQGSSVSVSTPTNTSTAVSSAMGVTEGMGMGMGGSMGMSDSMGASSELDADLKMAEEKVVGDDIEEGVILDCGGNPKEARAKDCVYDVMMQDWVPKPCYDSVLTERYLAQGNWTWYADGAGNTTISDDQMRKGEHGAAWMSSDYHKAHCVFSWMKIIRALRNGRGISQELLSYDHVLHCSHGALKEEAKNVGLGVKAPTNYAKCALYETWKAHPLKDEHDSTS